jgi:hypothetical protein
MFLLESRCVCIRINLYFESQEGNIIVIYICFDDNYNEKLKTLIKVSLSNVTEKGKNNLIELLCFP